MFYSIIVFSTTYINGHGGPHKIVMFCRLVICGTSRDFHSMLKSVLINISNQFKQIYTNKKVLDKKEIDEYLKFELFDHSQG